MNLDAVTIAIRPRRPWEAVDLGVLMARRWWWLLTKVWLTVSLPFWLALCFLPQDMILWQIVIFWYLKPIFERPLLYVLSHAVFDQVPSYRATLKAATTLIFRKLFATLLLRRLHPGRSMNLPVDQLEGLSGGKRSDRLTVLDREDSGPIYWLTFLGFFLEVMLTGSLITLIYAFIPHAVDVDLYGLFVEREYAWFNLLINTMYFFALSLVAPFYVAMGFALYLNRRIKLEAWDIEIAFRRIAQKQAKEQARKAQLGGGAAALLLAAVLCFSTTPSATHAADDTFDAVPVEDRQESKERVEAVFADEAFHRIKEEKVIDYEAMNWTTFERFMAWWSEFWEDSDEADTEFDSDLDIAPFAGFIAKFGEFLLWFALICLVAFVAYRYRHWLLSFNLPDSEKEEQKAGPETLFGMDVRPQSLPLNVSEQALQYWQDGQYRTALALLYRATLVDLFKLGLEVDEGATEQECLKAGLAKQKALNIADAPMQYFADLTFHWRRLAYGHIAPSDEQGVELCNNWMTVWRSAQKAGVLASSDENRGGNA